MYIILTLPIVTPAAILIQFQLMRIITHNNRTDDSTDDADIDSDSDEEPADIEAKSPPSPLCIEVVISDSADSPQQPTRELEKNLTQRTSLQPPSQYDDELSCLISSSAADTTTLTSPLFGSGSMILPSNSSGFDISAMNIVHFDSCDVDDDDDVVGHSMLPPLSTSRLWMLWSAVTLSDKRYTKQWSHALDQNLVVCV